MLIETDGKAVAPRFRDQTGIPGLDYLLKGGLPRHRLYVVEGDPGSGKTTLALQYLMAGARQGERVLYVTLSETIHELEEVAASHGWSLADITLLELNSLAGRLQDTAEYTVYHPSDVELGETTRQIKDAVERLQPTRVALDSVSEFKILADSNARYRREILSLKQYFAGRQCTVLILDDKTSPDEQQLQSIAHGVIRMMRAPRDYGNTRRQLQVIKMRGVKYRDGVHDFTIETGGIAVFPRLTPTDQKNEPELEDLSSGVVELDQLLGGGVQRSSSTLVMGPAGCGKSTLCSQFILTALTRGERVVCFLFEESVHTFLERANGMGLDLRAFYRSGLLELTQVDPAEISPGEFGRSVLVAVEERRARMVLIDSLNGYLNAMPSERFLLIQMHELLTYLAQRGVITFLVLAQHGLMGAVMGSPLDVSYLADSVILLRYFEAEGEVRQAISVVKKRKGAHERTIRELRLSSDGIRVGEPLREFVGVLTGVPRYRGDKEPLLTKGTRP